MNFRPRFFLGGGAHFIIRTTHEAISADLGLDVTGQASPIGVAGWLMGSWVHGMVTMADVHWRILGKQW